MDFLPVSLNGHVSPGSELPSKCFQHSMMERSNFYRIKRTLAIAIHGDKLIENIMDQWRQSPRVSAKEYILDPDSVENMKGRYERTSKNDVQIGSVSGLTLEPSARGNNGVNQLQSRCCAFCVQCFEPPITPARSSAAPRCLFWSPSLRSSSMTGFIFSSGASSRSWTVCHS